jgi:limonene-1,2-epoxide hydrolase
VTNPASPGPTSPSATTPAGPAATTGPVATVRAFLDALSRLDTDAALALLADDVVYQNVSLPTATGKPAVARQLGWLTRYATGFQAINRGGRRHGAHRAHRRDRGRPDARAVLGVRHLRGAGGQDRALARDYFDRLNVVSGVLTGAGRALVDLARHALGR